MAAKLLSASEVGIRPENQFGYSGSDSDAKFQTQTLKKTKRTEKCNRCRLMSLYLSASVRLSGDRNPTKRNSFIFRD